MNNVPSRLSVWVSVFIVCIIAVPLASVAALYVIAWSRASSPVEWEFARSTIETYEPAAFGLLFLFLGIAPVVMALLYHGKRTFVEKYRAEYRKHEELKCNLLDFAVMCPNGDVHAVLERLRSERLEALAKIPVVAAGKPEEMKVEDSSTYQYDLTMALSDVGRLTNRIRNARHLAVESLGLVVAPDWYYLCPKPDYPPEEAIAMQAEAERRGTGEKQPDEAREDSSDWVPHHR